VIRIGIISALVLVLALSLATYLVNKKTVYQGDHTPTTGNTVTIILIDGLSQKVFESTLQKGFLPNIQALMPNSTYVRNGIGSFPSMTGYAYYPFITGIDATRSGILGLRWFDRSRDVGNLRNYVGRSNVYMNQDVTDTIKNIFEMSGDMYTSSINSYMNKGVDDSRITGWAHTTAKFEGKSVFGPIRAIPIFGKELAKDHFQHEWNVLNIAKDQLLKNPKVQWITFTAPDASHHIFGMTAAYEQLLIFTDYLIGDLQNHIDSLGQKQNRMIALLTDHGVSDVSKNLDIVPVAKEKIGLDLVRGNSVNYRSMQLNDPLMDFVDKDGYWVINGNLSSYLYLRDPTKSGPESWRENLNYDRLLEYQKGDQVINVPQSISDLEGVELVIYKKDQHTIIVQNKEGIATITKENDFYKYTEVSADPLNYHSLQISDTLLTKDQWLDLTNSSSYPDAPYRLFSLMQSPNIADLVITSSAGYDLAKDYEVIVDSFKGGHGGLHEDQLRVPYLLYTAEGAKKHINAARAEDVGKEIIRWLGFDQNE